jgi:peptidylprolyl isomerase
MLKKGDFVVIDFTAKIKETDDVFDTTLEEISKKAKMHKDGDTYEPKLVVIGEGWIIKAVDEALSAMEVGKQSVIEIPSDKAFGPRNPELEKRVSLTSLREKGINPTLKMRVEYGGKTAFVRAIGAGRVLLDFNPPLAGKTLVYEVTIKKILVNDEEKLRALIHRRIPTVGETKFGLALTANAVTITMPQDTFFLDGVQRAKQGLMADIERYFPSIKGLTFIEPFKEEKKEVPQPTEEQKATVKGAVQVLNGEHK